MVRYQGASGDFNPIHHDEEFAKSAGYPSVFSVGMLQAGILASFATDWLGAANVRRYAVQFREQVWPGDHVVCSGKVTRRYEDGGRPQGRRRVVVYPRRVGWCRDQGRGHVRRTVRCSEPCPRAGRSGRRQASGRGGADRHPAARSRRAGVATTRARRGAGAGARVRMLSHRPARRGGRPRAAAVAGRTGPPGGRRGRRARAGLLAARRR